MKRNEELPKGSRLEEVESLQRLFDLGGDGGFIFGSRSAGLVQAHHFIEFGSGLFQLRKGIEHFQGPLALRLNQSRRSFSLGTKR
jgi:hypothetical protein